MHTLLTFAIALLMLGISSSMKMFIEMRYFVFLRKTKDIFISRLYYKLRTYEPNKIPKYSHVSEYNLLICFVFWVEAAIWNLLDVDDYKNQMFLCISNIRHGVCILYLGTAKWNSKRNVTWWEPNSSSKNEI